MAAFRVHDEHLAVEIEQRFEGRVALVVRHMVIRLR
jgi:hypothetical protein